MLYEDSWKNDLPSDRSACPFFCEMYELNNQSLRFDMCRSVYFLTSFNLIYLPQLRLNQPIQRVVYSCENAATAIQSLYTINNTTNLKTSELTVVKLEKLLQ